MSFVFSKERGFHWKYRFILKVSSVLVPKRFKDIFLRLRAKTKHSGSVWKGFCQQTGPFCQLDVETSGYKSHASHDM